MPSLSAGGDYHRPIVPETTHPFWSRPLPRTQGAVKTATNSESDGAIGARRIPLAQRRRRP